MATIEVSTKPLFGVFPYANGGDVDASRGYVVQECFADGRPMDGFNYAGVKPVRTFKASHPAKRHADKLNGF